MLNGDLAEAALWLVVFLAAAAACAGLQNAVSRSSSMSSGSTQRAQAWQPTGLGVAARNAASFSASAAGSGYSVCSVASGTNRPQQRGGWYGLEPSASANIWRRHSAWYVCWHAIVTGASGGGAAAAGGGGGGGGSHASRHEGHLGCGGCNGVAVSTLGSRRRSREGRAPTVFEPAQAAERVQQAVEDHGGRRGEEAGEEAGDDGWFRRPRRQAGRGRYICAGAGSR